jgi:DDE superfamily endonuclease
LFLSSRGDWPPLLKVKTNAGDGTVFGVQPTKIHCGEAVKSYLSDGASARLRLIRLPAYAPELNPSEGLWGWLKGELGNVCCPALDGLKDELLLAVNRLRRRQDVLMECFKKAGLQT